MKTQKIVIVGGGSAGWMTAATMVAVYPQKEIVVIESPDVPRVGVGESTLQHIRNWMSVIGLSDSDFMSACDSTYKLSIKFTNFYREDDSEGFHYPFGNPHFFEDSRYGLNDWKLKKAIYPDTPRTDYVRTFYPQMPLIEHGKLDLNADGKFGQYNHYHDTSFHFDAIKFANWLRDNYCVPRGVTHLPTTVSKINVNDDGIESLVLESGDTISGDLFIDCTGFKSLLLGGALKEEFVSFSDRLPNNRAWASRVPYTDKESEMVPYTNCTALSHGWVWNIPIWTRIGMGYVYSDKYVSPEDALVEFKNHLRSLGKDVDDLEFRDISFRVGIHRRTWVKNCVGIGLSAGFIEPLESNGLLTIHEFLIRLSRLLGREHITQYDRDIYNTETFKYFSDFAHFVSAHYSFSQRRDNQYWRDTERLSMNHGALAAMGSDFMSPAKIENDTCDNGLKVVSVGMGYDTITPSMIKEIEFGNDIDVKSLVDNLDSQWNIMKSRSKEFADGCLSQYEFLKRTIYADTSQTGTGA